MAWSSPQAFSGETFLHPRIDSHHPPCMRESLLAGIQRSSIDEVEIPGSIFSTSFVLSSKLMWTWLSDRRLRRIRREQAMSSGWTGNGLLHMELSLELLVSLLERHYFFFFLLGQESLLGHVIYFLIL